jgi:hypothetical protein
LGYVTLAALKSTLGITTNTHDDDLTNAIDAATEAIDDTTGATWDTSTPARIVLACSILSARYFKRISEAPFGVAGIGIDGAPVRISAIDPDVKALLDAYTLPLIG